MKIIRVTIILITIFSVVGLYGQEAKETKKVYRPDIPGSFLIDFGVNGTKDAPKGFEKGWFGSRTFNFYYYYPLRLGKSKFMFNPGIGVGIDRFKFTNNYYLADTAALDGRFELVPNYLDTDGDLKIDSATYTGIRKSFLNANYLDIPLEFRYNVNPDDLARTFWVAIGGRVGWMYSANSKIKQKVDGEKIVHKDKYRHGLNQFRYGVSLRIGMGNFNFFGFYNLSPLFESGKGPSQTKMTSFTMGISLVGL
jgi:hypothetical protein